MNNVRGIGNGQAKKLLSKVNSFHIHSSRRGGECEVSGPDSEPAQA